MWPASQKELPTLGLGPVNKLKPLFNKGVSSPKMFKNNVLHKLLNTDINYKKDGNSEMSISICIVQIFLLIMLCLQHQ